MNTRLSIRVRLTAWYAAVLLVILSALSFGVYAFVRASLERAFRAQLDRDIDTVATVIAAAPRGEGSKGHLPGDIYFLVREDQRVVYHSAAWCRAKWLHDFYMTETGVWRSPKGIAFKLRTAPLWIRGRGYDVTVAEDASPMDDTLATLLKVLLLSAPCAVLLSIGGGYFLAGRALSPLSAMAEKAREITAESLSERLPPGNPNDELGRMAAVFNSTLARLEASFERLRAFTANVSHELRTPLTALRSVGEVALRRPPDSGSCREAVASMLEEVDRLTRLVDALLTLARAEQGRKSARAPVDLAIVAQSVVDLLRVLAEEKKQSLEIDVVRPASLRGDSATLHQALTNLLDNAIRYTPAGGHIRVKVDCPPGGGALVDVTDDGPGIPPEERERIFDRFYRSNDDRRVATHGAGLGLAIARAAVEANGGRLEYDARPSGTDDRLASSVHDGSLFRMIFTAEN